MKWWQGTYLWMELESVESILLVGNGCHDIPAGSDDLEVVRHWFKDIHENSPSPST